MDNIKLTASRAYIRVKIDAMPYSFSMDGQFKEMKEYYKRNNSDSEISGTSNGSMTAFKE